MPKMRSHKATKKRFKVTGTGQVMRRRPGTSHLAPGKTQKRIRHLRKGAMVSKGDLKRLKQIVSNLK